MTQQKSLWKGLALVALGASAAVAVTHLRVDWQRSDAAPTAQVAADV